jgi:hypothetical protein
MQIGQIQLSLIVWAELRIGNTVMSNPETGFVSTASSLLLASKVQGFGKAESY